MQSRTLFVQDLHAGADPAHRLVDRPGTLLLAQVHIVLHHAGLVGVEQQAFAQRGLVVEGLLKRRGAGARDLQLNPRRMVERLHGTDGPFKKLLLGQASFCSGRSALSLSFFARLLIRQGLAHGRQLLQGFGFQK